MCESAFTGGSGWVAVAKYMPAFGRLQPTNRMNLFGSEIK
jgi:hypothetical protein